MWIHVSQISQAPLALRPKSTETYLCSLEPNYQFKLGEQMHCELWERELPWSEVCCTQRSNVDQLYSRTSSHSSLCVNLRVNFNLRPSCLFWLQFGLVLSYSFTLKRRCGPSIKSGLICETSSSYIYLEFLPIQEPSMGWIRYQCICARLSERGIARFDFVSSSSSFKHKPYLMAY